ncbi:MULTISPECIES: hypothetical protein [unclassified Fusobacterium]|uniref:hypothetical protein n=1 Tax=unclassified Fusobacterium TaxID=2648384 RepID=UPI001B8AB925|nr:MULTISPECIES: hypothetical protein [unclassified Fusobacterium]MBR8701399.1 hypothetical protein [Fusobacterium sp. DD45]MBR8711167.1 hypothetical protein [Fusobacterium sp. DD28]MBR8751716.1 hypothetical protein [Fusobacterium sp. DD26]
MLLEISRIKNGGETKIKEFSEYLQVIFETDENNVCNKIRVFDPKYSGAGDLYIDDIYKVKVDGRVIEYIFPQTTAQLSKK